MLVEDVNSIASVARSDRHLSKSQRFLPFFVKRCSVPQIRSLIAVDTTWVGVAFGKVRACIVGGTKPGSHVLRTTCSQTVKVFNIFVIGHKCGFQSRSSKSAIRSRVRRDAALTRWSMVSCCRRHRHVFSSQKGDLPAVP